MVPLEGGHLTLPSTVAYLRDGKILVGRQAKRAALHHPDCCLSSTKRFMGKRWPGDEGGLSPPAPLVSLDGCLAFQLPHGPVTPEGVATVILGRLLRAAAAATGVDSLPSRAVISVPAYFDEAARAATVAAGLAAGLAAVRLVHEPVAAGLAYGLDLHSEQSVLVVDLGGGTLDVSILEVGGGMIEVLATAGDPALGGDDWDAELAAWMAKQARRAGARLDLQDVKVQARLRRGAEAAKIRLSSFPTVDVRMPGTEASFRLTSQLMDSLSAHLYRRARTILDKACWQAGLDLEEVRGAARRCARGGERRADARAPEEAMRPTGAHPPVTRVVLVGGATRMPGMRRLVANMTGLDVGHGAVDPDLAVALGAAISAGVRDGSVGDLMVMDVWQAALMRAFARQQA